MEGYRVTRIVSGNRSADGEFVVIFENQHGNERGLQLPPSELSDLLRLLQRAQSQLSPIPDHSEGKSVLIDTDAPVVSVARIEIQQPVDLRSPSSHGIFEVRLEGDDGRGVTLRMPHEEVVRWRDTLSLQIEQFVRERRN